MAGFGQYLKDTQGELRHVAWPTRTQTILYTVLVIFVSIAVAVYLGIFDLLFTSGLQRVLDVVPSPSPITITQQPATPTASSTPTDGTEIPVFDVTGTDSTQ